MLLLDGKLGGAALDVFASEPLGPEPAAVFATVPNLLLTPHVAGQHPRIGRSGGQGDRREGDDGAGRLDEETLLVLDAGEEVRFALGDEDHVLETDSPAAAHVGHPHQWFDCKHHVGLEVVGGGPRAVSLLYRAARWRPSRSHGR